MTRRCGECTLCCKVLPVGEIAKPAATVCRHQRSSGCRIYDERPRACRLWSCAWLIDDRLQVPRPDRAHYIIDPSPEFATINDANVGVIQIWVDPRYPAAYRDRALFDCMAARWDSHKQIGIIRLGPRNGFLLIPPNLVADWWPKELTGRGWLEAEGTVVAEHTAAEIAVALATVRRNARE